MLSHLGDVPEQPPFAKDIVFWVMTMCACVLGVVMGFAGLAFLNIIDEVPPFYLDNNDYDNPDDGQLYAGKVHSQTLFHLFLSQVLDLYFFYSFLPLFVGLLDIYYHWCWISCWSSSLGNKLS